MGHLIVIINGNNTITLSFLTEEEREKMVSAIENCIKIPDDYPMVKYHDKKDKIIFTAYYLKNSLIKMPQN